MQPPIHIGRLIEARIHELGVGKPELAERIGRSRKNLYELLERSGIDTELLVSISRALRFNFFKRYADLVGDYHDDPAPPVDPQLATRPYVIVHRAEDLDQRPQFVLMWPETGEVRVLDGRDPKVADCLRFLGDQLGTGTGRSGAENSPADAGKPSNGGG